MNLEKFNNEKGIALIMVLILLIVVGGLTASLMASSVFNIRFGGDEVDRNKAFYAADSGIEYIKNHLHEKGNENNVEGSLEFWKLDESKTSDTDHRFYIDGQDQVSFELSNEVIGFNKIRFESIGHYNGVDRSIDYIVEFEVAPASGFFDHVIAGNEVYIKDTGTEEIEGDVATNDLKDEANPQIAKEKVDGEIKYDAGLIFPRVNEDRFKENDVEYFDGTNLDINFSEIDKKPINADDNDNNNGEAGNGNGDFSHKRDKYLYADNFILGPQDNMTVNGTEDEEDVKETLHILVTEKFHIHGNAEVLTNNGANLVIYLAPGVKTPDEEDVILNGTIKGNIFIYAPDTYLRLRGTANIKGGIIGDKVDASGDFGMLYVEGGPLLELEVSQIGAVESLVWRPKN